MIKEERSFSIRDHSLFYFLSWEKYELRVEGGTADHKKIKDVRSQENQGWEIDNEKIHCSENTTNHQWDP